MVCRVVVGEVLIGTGRILSTLIAHLVGLHILGKEYFSRHVHVFHPFERQMHINVLVVDHSENLIYFCSYELR